MGIDRRWHAARLGRRVRPVAGAAAGLGRHVGLAEGAAVGLGGGGGTQGEEGGRKEEIRIE